MAEACYMARATTKQQVLNGVNKLTFQTKKHGQYNKGMEKLLNNGNNMLTLVKSTDAITANYVIKKAKNRADKLTASTGKTVLPSITSRVEEQEEANQLNVINQLVIGAKEGVVEATTKLVGSNVTNAIL
jgi:hypothetical protein